MIAFLIAAAALLAASLALLSRPWWQRRSADSASRRALNATIYRDQLAELERDREAGQLGEADFVEARAEIQRRLLDDAVESEPALAQSPQPRRGLVLMLLTLPVAAFGLYAWLGNPAALDQMARRDFTNADIERMVAGLAAKLENEPDNLQGWAMLARSYKAMGRYEDSERAFVKAGPLVEREPQLLSDYADLLATKAGGRLDGKPEELIAKALRLDPNHLQTLWLAGTAAFARDDFRSAVEYWQRGLAQLPPGGEDARMLAAIIGEARDKMGGGKVGTAGTIGGRVELSPELRASAGPADTVFVLARAAGGGPMPLAVKRYQVSDLPLDFTLGDQDAISPDQKLSSAKSVRIEARVAKSGDAKAQPGDLAGSAGPVKLGAKGLRIVIDKVVR
jgi:cytochrome c-type biogenesis protein CcmH